MQKSAEDQSKKIVELELQIDKLIKQLYGPKSERSVDDPNQLTLNFGDDAQSKDAIADAVIEAEKIVQEFIWTGFQQIGLRSDLRITPRNHKT